MVHECGAAWVLPRDDGATVSCTSTPTADGVHTGFVSGVSAARDGDRNVTGGGDRARGVATGSVLSDTGTSTVATLTRGKGSAPQNKTLTIRQTLVSQPAGQ